MSIIPSAQLEGQVGSSIVQFSDIEDYKENIQPLREGRSAQSLANALAVTPLQAKDLRSPERQEFEKRISEASELDDPIEPYLEYIKWINNAFPQGQTSDSGLVNILERCTSQFRDASFYKDDPRYLKVWMQYAKYSDAPKEIFTYLARKEIGKNLSLFYEEYASYLEVNNCKNQANEVYQIGISVNARPLERLKRRYSEFSERLARNPPDANEPSSPVLPIIRPALALKGGPLSADPIPASVPSFNDGGVIPAKSKLQVFSDTTDSSSKATSSGGWDSIGSLASRKKENVIQPTSWTGQTLPTQGDYNVKKTLSVFKDTVSKELNIHLLGGFKLTKERHQCQESAKNA
ncbi:Mad3p [Sugiyamaella lignohabitans]|uniref:Mad3p n=1 Tax=Sugiyamaella lignohabitans TaxID=796027 RepID=A0A167DVT8_9ASCO|nr:Mad3p [Sugiyamaella lignohabitans]ANB13350.1 Mad3p [Sugiyamaella lignohabitans]